MQEHDPAHQAACELIYRHGPAAVGLAEERAAQLERAARWRDHADALRVLTAVERLLRVGHP